MNTDYNKIKEEREEETMKLTVNKAVVFVSWQYTEIKDRLLLTLFTTSLLKNSLGQQLQKKKLVLESAQRIWWTLKSAFNGLSTLPPERQRHCSSSTRI